MAQGVQAPDSAESPLFPTSLQWVCRTHATFHGHRTPGQRSMTTSSSEQAARRIQHANSSHRVRRAASILAMLPADLKQLTLEFCRASPPALELEISWERMVAAKFSGCGVEVDAEPHIKIPSARHRSEQHFKLLAEAYNLATLHYAVLTIASVRIYLDAAQQFSMCCVADVSSEWVDCLEAIRCFAERVLKHQLTERGATVALAISYSAAWWRDPRRVLEAAIVCTDA